MEQLPFNDASNLDDRQRRIHRQLGNLVSPGTAKWFHNACRIVARRQDHQAASHLVAHCVREVESSLRDALQVVIEPSPPGTPESTRHGLLGKPRAFLRRFISRFTPHEHKRDNQVREIRSAARFLGLPDTDRVLDIWLSLAGKKNAIPLHQRAHRENLLDPRPFDGSYVTWWEDVQYMLDHVLNRFEARFLEVLIPIGDRLSAIACPSKADAKWFVQFVPNNLSAQQQALARCNSVEWLAALEKAGYFTRPPGEEPGDEPGTVLYPPWAAAAYLLEVAPLAPALAAAIIERLAGQGNPRVQTQIAQVALAIPPSHATPWTRAFIAKSKDPYLDSLLADVLVKVIIHLAKGGQGDAALELTRSLFGARLDDRLNEQRKAAGLPMRAETRGRFDLWHYERGLREVISELVKAGGVDALRSLVTLLDQVLELEHAGDEEPGEDHSTAWRSTIRGDGHLAHGPSNALVSAVRDAAMLLLSSGCVAVAEVLGELAKSKWQVVRRIEQHLLASHPDFARIESVLKEWIATPRRDPEPESFYLAQAQFGALTEPVRHALLEEIGKGPDRKRVHAMQENMRRFVGMPAESVTDEDVARFVRDW